MQLAASLSLLDVENPSNKLSQHVGLLVFNCAFMENPLAKASDLGIIVSWLSIY